MVSGNETKWQEEVEQILRERYQGDELLEVLKEVGELVALANTVGMPSGGAGSAVAVMLKMASDELYPLAAIYVGYRFGVAWERYQNANRA